LAGMNREETQKGVLVSTRSPLQRDQSFELVKLL